MATGTFQPHRWLLAAALLTALAPAVAAERSNASARRAPTVAIVLSGDAAIAGPAGKAVSQVAREQGFRVIEGRGRTTDPRAYARKADAVFVIDANPVGATEVEYYGNLSTLYSAQVSLSAYRPSDGELLWDAPALSVDFTSLNAREKAEEAMAPLLADVEQELRRVR
jgi:eukaryotic-like serine/threonine-protein kinase